MAEAAIDVVYRAYVGADAAFHAFAAFHVERLVREEEACKKAAEEARIDAWPSARHEMPFVATVGYGFNVRFEVSRSFFFLFFFLFGLVYIEERQPHVRLRHDEREGCIETDALLLQVTAQDVDSLANVVAGGAKSIDIMASCVGFQPTYKFAHYFRRSPSVNWKAEAYAFAIGYIVENQGLCRPTLGVVKKVGDENQFVARPFGYFFGSPSGVASV